MPGCSEHAERRAGLRLRRRRERRARGGQEAGRRRRARPSPTCGRCSTTSRSTPSSSPRPTIGTRPPRSWPATPASTSTSKSRSRTTSAKAGCWSKPPPATRRCVQHGTQSRSTPMMIEAVKLLRDGIIGDVLVAKCWNIQRRGSIGRGQDTDPPAGLRLRHLGRPGHDDSLSHEPRPRPLDAGGITSAPATWATTAFTTSTTPAGAWASTRIPPRSRPSAASSSSTTTRNSPTRSRSTFEYPGDGKPGSQRTAHLRAAAVVHELSAQRRQRRRVLRHEGADVPQPPRQDRGAATTATSRSSSTIKPEAAGRRGPRAEFLRRDPRRREAQRRRADRPPLDVAVPPGQHRHAPGPLADVRSRQRSRSSATTKPTPGPPRIPRPLGNAARRLRVTANFGQSAARVRQLPRGTQLLGRPGVCPPPSPSRHRCSCSDWPRRPWRWQFAAVLNDRIRSRLSHVVRKTCGKLPFPAIRGRPESHCNSPVQRGIMPHCSGSLAPLTAHAARPVTAARDYFQVSIVAASFNSYRKTR